jgi:hypothetical protein
MKRLLASGAGLAALLLAASAASAATYYVSNAANNGYALGVDTNACTSISAPCLTIAGAMSKTAAGDTITVNPSGTPYAESSGSGYLAFGRANLTLRTDPAYVASVGKAVLRSNPSGSRILNAPYSGDAVQNFVLDGTNTTGSGAVSVQTGVSAFTLTGVDFKNLIAFATAITQVGGTAIFLDKVTLTSANGNATSTNLVSPANAGVSMTLTGVTVSGVNAAVYPAGHNSTTLIRLGASADGTRNSLSNLAYGVVWPTGAGVVNANVDIEATDFSGTFTSAIGGQSSPTEAVTALTIKNNAFLSAAYPAIKTTGAAGSYASVLIAYNQYTGSNSFLASNGTGLANAEIEYNTITTSSATADPILFNAGWSGIEIQHNILTTDQGAGSNTGHAIAVGPDGQSNMVVNTASATTTLAFGDTASDAYIDQPAAVTIGGGSAIPSSFSFKLSAVGSPAGTITAYLAADNGGGGAGSTIEASDLSGITLGTFSASLITSTPTWFQFWLPAHSTLTTGTYHLVLAYGGAPDPSNYVKLAANTATTSANRSSDGSTWTSSGASALYLLQNLAFDIVDPLVHDNTVVSTTPGATGLHDIALFGTLGGKVYRNQTYGGSIGVISKLSDGSVGGHPLLAYDNLIFQANSTNSRQGLRDKGSRAFKAYQNTVVLNGDGTAAALTVDNDYDTINTPQYSGQPSQNFTSGNNILYATAASAASSLYVLGGPAGAAAAVRVVNPTLNYDLIYLGTNYQALADIRTGTSVNYATLTAMQGVGFGLNSKVGDPRLFNEVSAARPSDFVPAYNSPAAGLGSNLVSIVPADFNGTAFTAKPTVGAINLLSRLQGGVTYANSRPLLN